MQVGDGFRFWDDDYEPLPQSLAVQLVFAIGIFTGMLSAYPFTISFADVDAVALLLLTACFAGAAFLIAFLRLATFERPARWMTVVGFGAGLVIGIGGQIWFSPG